MEAEVLLLTEWLFKAVGKQVPDDAQQAFVAEWRRLLAQLPADKAVMVLRDYHAENLMWLDTRQGMARAGLLDFQDALAGSPAYDLISLTEDARRDVSADLGAALTRRYIERRKANDADLAACAASCTTCSSTLR